MHFSLRVPCCAVLLWSALEAQQPTEVKSAPAAAPAPIDFKRVDRTAPKLPPTKHATYGIYLFGDLRERC